MAEVLEKIRQSYEAKANVDKGKVRKAFADKFSLTEKSFGNRLRGDIKLKEEEIAFLTQLLKLD